MPILKDKFEKHNFYKDKLLSIINNQKDCLKNYNKDKLKKCDWNESKDFERLWVKLIIDDLKKQFFKFTDYLGLERFTIHELWNQQYDNNGEHGWHVHGHNYTGVYYLNFNEKCAKTRLLDPYTKKYFIDIEAEEGDIVIFPSSVIHTSQIQKTNFLKTIISFNISFDGTKKKIYDKIDKEVKIIK
jgi:hypothetical protein